MLNINDIILERYKILSIAGKGGMGLVYLAEDITDGSRWAIKEDLTDRGTDQLYEEAEVLSGLEHPALPRCRGVKRWNRKHYMIMQYMEGTTLSQMLKQQSKFPERQVLSWFQEICDVLRYLHSRPKPIVYRDLKPSNIIINHEGHVKIIDFGIAEEYAGQNDHAKMRKFGLTKGYAAPEQYNRRFKADVRTDIYALGVTIHYLLTGKNPIKPPYEFVPVRKLSPEVSPALESIVKQCLQPNPDARYASAEALYYDLTHISEKEKQLRQVKHRRALGIGAIALVIACGLLILALTVHNRRQNQIEAYHAMITQALSEAESRNYPQALALLEQAVQAQPKEITAYLTTAQVYLMQEQYSRCLDYVNSEILDRFPDCYGNMEFLGYMARLYDRMGDPDTALYYYRQRCELDPTVAEHWLDLTNCLIAAGQDSQAEASLRQYLDAGGDPELYSQLLRQMTGTD